MSWIERIDKGIQITTGDGKVFTPLYIDATKSIEYNIAEFNFPHIEGTLAKRGTPMGTKYTLELIFQGEDNIDDGKDFEEAAKDPRAWSVSHPIYDTIILQPSRMEVDNTGLNTAKYTVECIETITEVAPIITADPLSQSGSNVEEQQIEAADEFAADVEPEVSDLNQLSENTATFYEEGSGIVTDNDELSEYFNAFQTANAAILNGTSDVSGMISSIQAVIEAPALFKIGVQARLNNLKNQMISLSETLENITTKNEKKIFENNAGALIMAMVTASINPQDDDYENSTDVLAVTDLLLAQHNSYMSNLQSLQSGNNYSLESYIPRYNSISQLNNTVEYAVSNLLQIALGAKQERSVILEYDSNIINLTHRFYGLTADGSTVKSFIRNNNIGLNEKLLIKKGRKLIYFV